MAARLASTEAAASLAGRLEMLDRWARTGEGLRSDATRNLGRLRRLLQGHEAAHGRSRDAGPVAGPAGAQREAAELLRLAEARAAGLKGRPLATADFLEIVGAKDLVAGVGDAVRGGTVPAALARRLLGTSRNSLRARLSAGLPLTVPHVDRLCSRNLAKSMVLWAGAGAAPWRTAPERVDALLATRLIRSAEVMARLRWRCAHPGCKAPLAGAPLCLAHAADLAWRRPMAAEVGAEALDEYLLSPLMFALAARGMADRGRTSNCVRPGHLASPEPLALVVCSKHLREWLRIGPPARLVLGRHPS